jgi:hypothetical protein
VSISQAHFWLKYNGSLSKNISPGRFSGQSKAI